MGMFSNSSAHILHVSSIFSSLMVTVNVGNQVPWSDQGNHTLTWMDNFNLPMLAGHKITL